MGNKRVESKRREILGAKVNCLSFYSDPSFQKETTESLKQCGIQGKVRRFWEKDSSLWTNRDESKWLGWLDIAKDNPDRIKALNQFARVVKEAGFAHVLLLGMGGSSLSSEVMKRTFGNAPGYPELFVLDSTDPSQIAGVESKIELKKTLFIVASKSGSTLEPNILKQYFFEKMKGFVGVKEVGKHFIAITDPNSRMQKVAEKNGFLKIFYGMASIGGRYSALSDFGLVPAATMGVDISKFWERTQPMINSCGPSVPPEENPGVILGTLLGVCAKHGKDKVTLIISPGYRSLGAWLEQLLAESTGKGGLGLIPVDLESIGEPHVYGSDRIFVYIRCDTDMDPSQEKAVEKLKAHGFPLITIKATDAYDIGQEFFRWEMATAVVGSILGINPFDQPDVEASKAATHELTTQYEKTGRFPEEKVLLEERGLSLFTDRINGRELTQAVSGAKNLSSFLGAHLNRLQPGYYFAILAYVAMNDTYEALLQSIRHIVRDAKHVATCLGFGPRFLHSTGQAYKGGTNSGVFLQITSHDPKDIAVPGQKYTFGIVKSAQAIGDFQVLAERKRRVLRVHLCDGDVKRGLLVLKDEILNALKP